MRKSHAGGFLVGLLIGAAAGAAAGPGRRPPRFGKLDVFAQVLSHVETNYVEDVDERKLVYGAAKGLVRTLDPHSAFLTPEELADMHADTDGEFGGVGLELEEAEGALVVVEPVPATPAARAGLLAGDRIVAVDGAATKGREPGEAASRLRGRPGTEVSLEVERKGWEGTRTFRLVREIIHVDAVQASLLEPGIGYLKIRQFQERTDEEVIAALERMRGDSGGQLGGLVLDLRGNPGGLLDQAIRVSDVFLSRGVIVTTVGRGGRKLEEATAREHGTWEGFPVACLVNSGSASAAEILAGALKDHGRAVVVGTRTFGKGSVQSVFELDDGSGLKLTVARYFTPGGRSIQERGIEPDVVVEQLDPDKLNEARVADAGQRERDLDGHLANPQADLKPQDSARRVSVELVERDHQLKTAYQALQSWRRFRR